MIARIKKTTRTIISQGLITVSVLDPPTENITNSTLCVLGCRNYPQTIVAKQCKEIPHICDDKEKALYAAKQYFEPIVKTEILEEFPKILNTSSQICLNPGQHEELYFFLPKNVVGAPEIVEALGPDKTTNHPGSLVSCYCCRNDPKAPGGYKIEEMWGVTRKITEFNYNGYTFFREVNERNRHLNDSELLGCGY